MLAGQYVTHDGETCQVRRIIDVQGVHTDYELQPVAGGPVRYVRDPQACDMPLADGPTVPRSPAPLPRPTALTRTRAWCADCRRTQRVVDESDETLLAGEGQVDHKVWHLSCGHQHDVVTRVRRHLTTR